MVKINMATGQWQNVAPNFGADAQKYRQARDFWKKFDPFDQTAMYVGYQCLLVTRDGARTWKAASPDLTTAKADKPVACGEPPPPPPGLRWSSRGARPRRWTWRWRASSTSSYPPAKRGVIWTVSNNGQINTSVDAGLHWTNVSNITDAPNVNFNTIDGAHHDVNTAYVSGRLGGGRGAAEGVDPNVPLIWRTHDGGKTWTKIVNGLPKDERTGSWVNVVREDPKQKGLLFAGTETTVYVSFDDGDHWQSLRQNLPSTSIRDLVFHTDDHMNDIVIGTYGRGFWVLDDVTPLREIAAKGAAIASAPAYFFKPGDAIRARLNINWDQPTSIEMPHAPNPPYGAILYYHLSKAPASEITLQVFDAAGGLVRTMSSILPPPIRDAIYPDYWVTPPAVTRAANRGRHEPSELGSPLRRSAGVPARSREPDEHGRRHHDRRSAWSAGSAGDLHDEADRRRQDLHADRRRPQRSEGRRERGDAGRAQVAAQADAARLSGDEGHLRRERGGRCRPRAAHAADCSSRVTSVRRPRSSTRSWRRSAAPSRDAAVVVAAVDSAVAAAAVRPGAMQSFIQLNNSFSTMVSMMQVGLDMAPTPAQINTWESNCKNYNTTVAAWKKAQADDLATFGGLKASTKLSPMSCGFAVPGRTGANTSRERSDGVSQRK